MVAKPGVRARLSYSTSQFVIASAIPSFARSVRCVFRLGRLGRFSPTCAVAARGPIECLVANAGGAESAPFLRSDAAMFRRMIDLNLMGAANATRAVLPGMIERKRGRIVAVASTAGLRGYAYVSAYVAAK